MVARRISMRGKKRSTAGRRIRRFPCEWLYRAAGVLAIADGRQNRVDYPGSNRYGWDCEWQFDYSTVAAGCAAAARRGSRVLIGSRRFPDPTAKPAVGFLFSAGMSLRQSATAIT